MDQEEKQEITQVNKGLPSKADKDRMVDGFYRDLEQDPEKQEENRRKIDLMILFNVIFEGVIDPEAVYHGRVILAQLLREGDLSTEKLEEAFVKYWQNQQTLLKEERAILLRRLFDAVFVEGLEGRANKERVRVLIDILEGKRVKNEEILKVLEQ